MCGRIFFFRNPENSPLGEKTKKYWAIYLIKVFMDEIIVAHPSSLLIRPVCLWYSNIFLCFPDENNKIDKRSPFGLK